MERSTQKIVQYLNEAHASELALVRVLQSQIAMTPRGTYRTALEKHLGETRDHAQRVERRLGELGDGANPLQAVNGIVQAVAGQALALAKTPLDIVRGSGGEEKVLKNARDASATEALEIATYTSIERLATAVGDDETARLAKSIRGDEERMLEKVLREIPKLTEAVAKAELKGDPSYDITRTGAADTARKAARTTRRTARRTTGRGGGQPWAGYDKQTVDDIQSRLSSAGKDRVREVRRYERAHKDRATVIEAADRQLANA